MVEVASTSVERATANDAPTIFAFLNAHPEFNDTVSKTIGVEARSKSRIAFLRRALEGGPIVILDLSIYDLAMISLMPTFVQRKIAIVHHNTAFACNDSFLKRQAKAAIFRLARGRHVFLSSRVARFHSFYFGIYSSFLPHPLEVRVRKKVQTDAPPFREKRGFISGNLNRRGSPFLAYMASRFNVDSRLAEHREQANVVPRFETMDDFLREYDYMVTDIDREYNRVSGILYDCLGAGLIVYAKSIPFIQDISRYASIEQVYFADYRAEKIHMSSRKAERYNQDFVSGWRSFVYGGTR